jgi:PEGA domain
MLLKSFIIPMTFAAALAVSVAPASAQHGGGGGGHMGGGGGGGHMGGGGHFGGGGHMSGGGHVGGGGHMSGGHAGSDQHGGGRTFHDGHGGFDRSRGHDGQFRGHDGFRDRRFGDPFVHARVIHGFHGPFFGFRPRFDLGFGLFVGYPFAYPWDYIAVDPYGYGYPYPYDGNWDGTTDNEPDALPAGTNSAPSDAQRNFGGVSLDIKPGDASVTVDGAAAGEVKDFSPSSAPLTLTPGQHHIVIAKPGYQSMTFDADVVKDQVIPYKGTMQRE